MIVFLSIVRFLRRHWRLILELVMLVVIASLLMAIGVM